MRAAQAARDRWSAYRDLDVGAYVEDRMAESGTVERLRRANRWLEPRRFVKWGVPLVAAGVLFLVLLFTGALGTFYYWLIGWTTQGEPWTDIMRNNPWIFWSVAIPLVIVLFKVVPRQAVGRLYLIVLVFLVGFLGGHVFW